MTYPYYLKKIILKYSIYLKGIIMNEIFICNWGNTIFEDLNHLNNFINYLFSKSKSHKQNKTTKYNFYKRKVDDKFKTGFVENNEQSYLKFLNNSELTSYINFNNDLFYIYFMIVIDNHLITNLLSIENESISLNITEDLSAMIINDYFNGEENRFLNKINETISYVNTNSLDIINYDHLIRDNDIDNLYLIKLIEIETHKKLQEKYFNTNVIFQISHNDQYDRPYHIHRLIYEKTN